MGILNNFRTLGVKEISFKQVQSLYKEGRLRGDYGYCLQICQSSDLPKMTTQNDISIFSLANWITGRRLTCEKKRLLQFLCVREINGSHIVQKVTNICENCNQIKHLVLCMQHVFPWRYCALQLDKYLVQFEVKCLYKDYFMINLFKFNCLNIQYAFLFLNMS